MSERYGKIWCDSDGPRTQPLVCLLRSLGCMDLREEPGANPGLWIRLVSREKQLSCEWSRIGDKAVAGKVSLSRGGFGPQSREPPD